MPAAGHSKQTRPLRHASPRLALAVGLYLVVVACLSTYTLIAIFPAVDRDILMADRHADQRSVLYISQDVILPAGDRDMTCRPVSLDHVNIYVRNAERSHRWYADVLGLHTQDTFMSAETGRLRAVFLSADPDHAHDIALFEVGEDAAGPQKQQVGLNHVAWRMASLEDFGQMYQRLKDMDVQTRVIDHTVSIGAYFSDPDGNGLEVYYELPRSQWHQDKPFSIKGTKGRFPGPWEEALQQSALATATA